MNFDSYIISETKTSLSMPLACPPKKLKRSKNFKCFAFTLAETLITLTIIGVVAALTIPTLMNKYTKHTYVVGLKKAYAQLQHAVKMIPITEGCSAGDYDCAGMFQALEKVTNIDGQDFGDNGQKKQMYLFSKQFKVQKLCFNSDTATECTKVGFDNQPTVILDDGSTFTFISYGIYVDVNGTKGPNASGRDIFAFKLLDKETNGIEQGRLIPFGSKSMDLITREDQHGRYWRNETYHSTCKTEDISTTPSSYYLNLPCAGRVLEEDAMNY